MDSIESFDTGVASGGVLANAKPAVGGAEQSITETKSATGFVMEHESETVWASRSFLSLN